MKRLLIIICVVMVSSAVLAVETTKIDQVRKKDVLSEADIEAIGQFVQKSVDEIVYAEDFTQVASVRQDLISRKNSLSTTSAQQYKTKFDEAALKVLTNAIGMVSADENGERSQKVMLNLMLVLYDVESVKLLPLAVEALESDQPSIQYLAAKAISNKELVDKLNGDSLDDGITAKDIADKFSEMLKAEIDPSVLECVVVYCQNISDDTGAKLLVNIANKRLQLYEKWQVSDEFVDNAVVAALGEKAARAITPGEKDELLAKMAQLYSYVIQSYIAGGDDLFDAKKSQLTDIIVGVENGIVSQLLGVKTQALKKAIERKDITALRSAHDALLGSGSSKGSLANAIDFSYGVDGEVKIVAPKQLTAKP